MTTEAATPITDAASEILAELAEANVAMEGGDIEGLQAALGGEDALGDKPEVISRGEGLGAVDESAVSITGEAGATDDFSSPMTAKVMSEAGHRWVYHLRTGMQQPCNNNMLPAQLKKIDAETGKRAFTIHKHLAPEPAKAGTYICFKHVDHEMWPVCKEMGFERCTKSNITSPYFVDLHMKFKHKREWDALEAKRLKEERDEDRAERRLQTEAMQALARGSVAVAEAPAEAAVAVAEPPAATEPDVRSGQCQKCEWKSEARKSQSRKSSLKTHMNKKHPED